MSIRYLIQSVSVGIIELRSMRVKRRYSKVGLICLIFGVFFIFLLITLSAISRSRNIHSHIASRTYPVAAVLEQDLLPPTPPEHEIQCDRSHTAYDFCKISGQTVFDPRSSTFYSGDPHLPNYTTHKIRPYPRKWENFTMQRIKELTLIFGPSGPTCEAHHNAPAVVFSAGGYTGNFFHDFNDGFIPLFITVNSNFGPNDRDFVLVISKARDWWISKYGDLLQTLSKHPIINVDNDTSTHCFTSANIGLITHGFMTIQPYLLPYWQSFEHFRAFLNSACTRHKIYRPMIKTPEKRPRLVWASRSGNVGRVVINQDEVKKAAEDIGFEVVIFEPKSSTPLHQSYDLIISSHALMGVHGAALTHALFLRPRAVFLQVVPLGNEKVGQLCFGNLGKGMDLDYMEYRIGVEESSLIDKYDENSQLIRDPIGFQGRNWSPEIMNIYLKEQNVRIDLGRFSKYLRKAYRKAKRFMVLED